MHQNGPIDTAAEILTILRDDIDIQVPSPDSELLESGLLDSVIFARNEPPLHHYHNTFRAALGMPALPLLQEV